jgi:hypothetical protein
MEVDEHMVSAAGRIRVQAEYASKGSCDAIIFAQKYNALQ